MRTVRNSSHLLSGGGLHPPGAGTPPGADPPRAAPPP